MPLAVSVAGLIEALIAAVQGALPGGGDLFVAASHAFSRQAAAIAVTSVWQGALIAFGLAICFRLAPRIAAKHRFTIWAAGFATIAGLPLFALISVFQGSTVAEVSAAGSIAASRPWLSIDARWGWAITALWATAALFRACDLAVHSLRLRRLWKEAIPAEVDRGLESLLASFADTWRRGSVQVCTTTVLQRPSVIGFLKPRILIPDWLFGRLTRGELEQIVLHEAEHLRRRDDWTNLFQKLCLVVFPLNPALVWMERRLCREREMACDEGVIRITRAPRAYAACLASLAERGIERRVEALSLGAWQRRPEVVHRVHSILRGRHTLGPVATRALLGVFGCGLLFGSIELARCPQLVGFAAARAHDRDGLSARATAPVAARASSAHAVKAAYVPARSGNAGQVSPGVSASKNVGVAPTDSERADGRVALEQEAMQQDVSNAGETSTNKAHSRTSQAVLLSAAMPNSNATPAEEQQWIVLTGWEQIQTSSRNSGMTADDESGVLANAPSDTENKSARNAPLHLPPARQITITRLILRIYPASPLSAQPASASIRGGWFVFQL